MFQEDVLQGVMKPLNMTVFSIQKWVFQKDSAPAHKAKTTQECLWRKVPGFINAEDWPLGSPDLNPRDYKLWAVLGGRGLPKASQQPGQPEEIPREAAAEIPPRDGACRDSRVAGVSEGFASGYRVAILSNIINKNLKNC